MAKLEKAQLFYVQHFADKKAPEEIAGDIGVDVRTVKAALRRIKAEADKAAPITAAAQNATEAEAVAKQPTHPVSFDPHGESKGVVSMTDARSKADDENPGPSARRPFLERYKDCIHVLDPNKPVR